MSKVVVSNLFSKIMEVAVIVAVGVALFAIGHHPHQSWGNHNIVSSHDFVNGKNQRQENEERMNISNSKAVTFDSEMMVNSYLRGKTFESNDGVRMNFSSNNEVVIDGRTITATMGVVRYTATEAVLRGYCPYDGTYLRLMVDSSIGRIQNMDVPTEIFYLVR